MSKIAIMVDAGYLLATAAKLVGGKDVRREDIALASDEVIFALHEAAGICEPTAELLRIYWYDASLAPERLTLEQSIIAEKRNCKLRLGSMSHGVQKGVDALILMDMLALSRNRAITSILLVAGDDDLRPAIDEVQSMGVRVHLLGVEAPPGVGNQSERLRRECDSSRELTTDDVKQFVRIVGAAGSGAPPRPGRPFPVGPRQIAEPPELVDAIDHALSLATDDQLRAIVDDSTDNFTAIPPGIDRPLLARYSDNLGRTPTDDERKLMRRAFVRRAREAL